MRTARSTAMIMVLAAGLCLITNAPVAADDTVACKRSPKEKSWRHSPVRCVSDMAGFTAPNVKVDRFGGEADSKGKATGFFRVERLDGRWWFIDPEGGRFISMGLNSTRPPRSKLGTQTMVKRLGDVKKWARHTADWYRSTGLNTLGCWSDGKLYRALDQPLVYTLQWNFAATFGRKQGRTHEKVGHTGFLGDCLPVLDPAFEAFCYEHARALAETRDDAWLLGHFSDNELPIYGGDMLKRYRSLPAGDANRRETERWLAARYGGKLPKQEIETDRVAFQAYVAQRYFAAVAAAIRKHDPNHLYLGCRFHGRALKERTVVRACARHVDVLSFNWYGTWTPSREAMDVWLGTGRPFLITEFYAKGMDTGMNNLSGAGWTVKTQSDRGAFYQSFTLGLLEHPGCVGWHWHRYRDNDPGDPRSKKFGEQSNKGFVDFKFDPYLPLTGAAAEVCKQVYPLADYLGAERAQP